MKNKTIQTNWPSGVTLLSGEKLAPYIENWKADGGSAHSLYCAMRGVPNGRGIDGKVIERIVKNSESLSVTDASKHGLVMALRKIDSTVTWNDISEDFEK